MRTFPHTLFLLILAMAAVSAASADGFNLSERLRVSGFLDMSTAYTNPEHAPSSTSSGLDQFEINFLFDFEEDLSAQVDLEYQDNGDGEEVDVEQAFFTYAVDDAIDFKAGRFLSYSGWETEEPTGLFQFSGTGYAKYFYGGYQQGVSVKYAAKMFNAALSVVNDLGDLEGEVRESDDLGIETMLALRPIDGLTMKVFYMTDKEATSGKTIEMINVWASLVIDDLVMGDLTLAAEINRSENTPAALAELAKAGHAAMDAEAFGYLLMANYATDRVGLTIRYHASKVESAAGATVEKSNAITLSPSFAVTDNLSLIAEYRTDDNDIADSGADSYALKALLTF